MPPLASLGPGDEIPRDRNTWNAFIAAGRSATRNQRGADAPESPATMWAPQVTILVRNDTGGTLGAFSIVKLGDPLLDPSVAPHVCRQTPLFKGITPTNYLDPFAVLIEPLAPGAIGRAAVLGVVPCDVIIATVNDAWAGPNNAGIVVGTGTAALGSRPTDGPAKIITRSAPGPGLVRCLVLLQGDMGGGTSAAAPGGGVAADGGGGLMPEPIFYQQTPVNGHPATQIYLFTDLTAIGISDPCWFTQIYFDSGGNPQFFIAYYPDGTGQPIGTAPTNIPQWSDAINPNQYQQQYTPSGSNPLYITIQDASGNPQFTIGSAAGTSGSYTIPIFTGDKVTGIDTGFSLWSGSAFFTSNFTVTFSGSTTTITYPGVTVDFASATLEGIGAAAIASGTINAARLPIDTDSTFAANSDALIPSQKAVKTALTGLGSGGLTWTKYTVPYTALAAAATSFDIQLFSLPAKGVIHAVYVKPSVQFTGGSLTSYHVNIGIATALTKYTAGFAVYLPITSTNFQLSTTVGSEDFVSATSIRIQANTAGANTNAATQGSVDVWVLTSVLP